MATKKKNTKKTQSRNSSLTLHRLLSELSFWGTSVRLMLFVFVAVIAFLVALSEAVNADAVENQVKLLIYAVAAFTATDFGYVMIARAYPVVHKIDSAVVVLADLFLAGVYVLPKLVVAPTISVTTDPVMFAVFVPLLVLSTRMLVGFLYVDKR